MPIYEYLCSVCQNKFELKRPMSEASKDSPCPKCGSAAPRILSTFAASSQGSTGRTINLGGGSCSACSTGTCSSCH